MYHSENINKSKNALEVRNLTIKKRKGNSLNCFIKNLSFTVPVGSFVFIIGRSGAGKSLTVRSISGLLNMEKWDVSGSIKVINSNSELITIFENNKYDYKALKKIRGKSMRVIFQEPSSHLHPSFTIKKQLFETLYHIPSKDRTIEAMNLLKNVGLTRDLSILDSHPHQFSQGEKQRIAIAMAISMEGQGVLISDEPTSSIDIDTRDEIIKLLKDLREEQKIQSSIIITHDEEVILKLVKNGDRLVHINDNQSYQEIECSIADNNDNQLRDLTKPFSFFKFVPNTVEKTKKSSVNQPLLEIINLKQTIKRSFFSRPNTILKNINLTIYSGEIIGIIGPSGSGKTSLAKAIIRLLDWTKGEILFNEDNKIVNLNKIQPRGTHPDTIKMNELRKQIQYISQEAAMVFNPSLMISEILDETKQLAKKANKTIDEKFIQNILMQTGLIADKNEYAAFISKYPSELSGGEKQRLNIVRCFLLEPKLVIADEPFASQDLQTASELFVIMKDFNQRYQTSFIIISHDINMIKKICKRVYLINNCNLILQNNSSGIL